MDSETETLEERLKTFLGHLQTECGIVERMVHKNRNQHRRPSYFQYLQKVQRDLRLLQSAKLDETLTSCFIVIAGKRPKQMVHLLESLKRRRCEDGTRHFIERLLGVARLLSEMVEPMLKAATAKCISYRKFSLYGDRLKYDSFSITLCFNCFSGVLDDMPTPMKTETYSATNEVSTSEIESDKGKQLAESSKKLDNVQLDENPSQNHPVEDILHESSSSPLSLNPFEQKTGARKVAFRSVSVTKPTPSPAATVKSLPLKRTKNKGDDKKDPFYKVLSAGTMKDSLFYFKD